MAKFKPSPWRITAYETIDNVVKSAPKNANLIELIDDAYPFSCRKNMPYKIWLEERKKVLVRLNIYKVPSNRECKYHPNGQTCLICSHSQK